VKLENLDRVHFARNPTLAQIAFFLKAYYLKKSQFYLGGT